MINYIRPRAVIICCQVYRATTSHRNRSVKHVNYLYKLIFLLFRNIILVYIKNISVRNLILLIKTRSKTRKNCFSPTGQETKICRPNVATALTVPRSYEPCQQILRNFLHIRCGSCIGFRNFFLYRSVTCGEFMNFFSLIVVKISW